MEKQAVYTVRHNRVLAQDVYEMRLTGPTGALRRPGQFVNIKIDGFYLRRPISVCDWDTEGMTLIYKVLGRGTARLSQYAPGTTLDLLTGLGNGFDTAPAAGHKVALVGGGVGVPPLYGLAKALLAAGNTPLVALGFRSAADVFYTDAFAALGCPVHLTTEDGTAGTQGFVTGPLATADYSYYYTCGPHAMLQAVYTAGAARGATGQLSFEERMGCGFGACMGCSCHTQSGAKRVCMEGPVFPAQEVVWA